MKIRRDYVDYLYFIVFGIIVVLFITGQFTNVTGTTLVVIDNTDPNSMFPTYFQGDLFVIRHEAPSNIHIGDVIVYKNQRGALIIHRVIDIAVDSNGNYNYRVKGDDPVTNYRPDPYASGHLIPYNVVKGKIITRVPFLGHFSLAMQNNPAVQILVLFFAAISVIGILAWPEDEEEEQEYYDISKKNWNQFKSSVSDHFRSFWDLLTTSKNRLWAWLLILLTLFGLFAPIVTPGLFMAGKSEPIGINKVTVGHPYEMNESISSANVFFFNLSIEMYDTGPLYHHIEGYTLRVFDNNDTQLDMTKWNTLRPIRGSFTIGGSITLDRADYLALAQGTQLTIEIVVHVDKLIGHEDLSPFYHTFSV